MASKRPTGASSAPASAPKRRLRFGALPKPAARASCGWGKGRAELADLKPADLVRLVMGSPEFEQILGPTLDRVDERIRIGRPIRWTARELESVLIYRRVSGLGTVKRTRERLSFDLRGRRLLGFDQLPSESTISRYICHHFAEHERSRLMKDLERSLRDKVCQLPGFQDEARILGLDGSQVAIRFTPPIPETNRKGKRTGRIANEGQITAPEAGFVGKSGGPKAGKGFQLIAMVTEHGTPVGWDISALQLYEGDGAQRVLEDYRSNVLPHITSDRLAVCTADGGFDDEKVRATMQSVRIVPNIHRASHGQSKGSVNNAAKLDRVRVPLHDPLNPAYSNWFTNGHGELHCTCGQGQIERRIGEANRRLSIATLGLCASCGTVTVTAGLWHKVQNPTRWVRLGPNDPPEDAERFMGNPLTFHDPLATEYGKDRFGWGESFHSTLASRFGLLRGKCWMKRKAQVECEFAIAFSAIHSLVLERQARMNAPPPQALAPPPTALAA